MNVNLLINAIFRPHYFDRSTFSYSCYIVEWRIVIHVIDYNKIVVHSNYFIYSKCSKLTSKFYKSQVGRECCINNTEVLIILFLYTRLLISIVPNNNFATASIQCFLYIGVFFKLFLYFIYANGVVECMAVNKKIWKYWYKNSFNYAKIIREVV